ncbi:hypothetical protein ONS95_005934 [Cadophora gregata]|uniref:uncharacterized protein n=1 Tax=Cadophora gregata TaxID=51156 RepID=UPI0026DC15B8|nr:uncharacterized protein ONS95_005934 [Cadophora gregata]KAK0102311.1 hypothetical protein ONS95_005934 [Cadophora gregata]KAK0103939.1 hypothetical protein ONS96_005046 [Cadophora gregata f. sp. sojae]
MTASGLIPTVHFRFGTGRNKEANLWSFSFSGNKSFVFGYCFIFCLGLNCSTISSPFHQHADPVLPCLYQHQSPKKTQPTRISSGVATVQFMMPSCQLSRRLENYCCFSPSGVFSLGRGKKTKTRKSF